MEGTLPFSFPAPAAGYFVLYLVTWVVHQACAGYVLAGSAWLAWSGLFPGRADPPRYRAAVAVVLRDWLPFVLGAAITAGVAPLLFLQVLHRPSFYTANLLLFHRWMAILPALILGFYLLYLLKSRRIRSWAPWLRNGVPLVALACFLFTAWSWTENHLVSLEGQERWAERYAEGFTLVGPPGSMLRLGFWFALSFSGLGAILLWQLRLQPEALPPAARRGLAATQLAALVSAALLGSAYVYRSGGVPEGAALYPWIAGAGFAGLMAGWLLIRRRAEHRWADLLVWISLPLALFAVAGVREGFRLQAVDHDLVIEAAARAADSAGLPLFLAAAAVNTGLIVWVLRLVRRG